MSPQPCRLGAVIALTGQRAKLRHGAAKSPEQDHRARGGGIRTRTRAAASLSPHRCARTFAFYHVCFSKTWPVRQEKRGASKLGSTETPHIRGTERFRSRAQRAEAGRRPGRPSLGSAPRACGPGAPEGPSAPRRGPSARHPRLGTLLLSPPLRPSCSQRDFRLLLLS